MSLAQPLPCLEAVCLQMLLFLRNGRADLRLGMVAECRRGVVRLQSPASHGRSVRETRRDPALSAEWKFRGASVRLGHLLVRRRARRPHYGEHVCRPRSAVDVFALLWVSYRKFCRFPPDTRFPPQITRASMAINTCGNVKAQRSLKRWFRRSSSTGEPSMPCPIRSDVTTTALTATFSSEIHCELCP